MIRIEIDDREVLRALDDLRRRASNMTQAMHAIGQALAEGSRERILDGRDWTGQPFAPNSPATLARKKGEKPLIDSKSLVRSRLHYQADADSVEVGSSAVQSAVLQFGARKGQFGGQRAAAKSPGAISRRGATCPSPRTGGWTTPRGIWCWISSGRIWPMRSDAARALRATVITPDHRLVQGLILPAASRPRFFWP